VFLASNLITGRIIRHVGLLFSIIKIQSLNPRTFDFAVLCTWQFVGVVAVVPVIMPKQLRYWRRSFTCLVSKLQKPYSSGLKPLTVLPSYGSFFCNVFFETNTFGLSAISVSRFISNLQDPPSPGLELRTIFRSFHSSLISFWPHAL
jgi:hypothetical protein